MPMTYETRIREWLRREGLTFRDAAEQIGCDHSTIARWLDGAEPKGLYRQALDRILTRAEKGRAR